MKKVFTLIVLCVFSLCTIHAEITWTLSDDGTLTISGTDMPDYIGNAAPWSSNKYSIMKVVINDGVTNIGGNAFYNCSGLTSITIPNSVTFFKNLKVVDIQRFNSMCFSLFMVV